MTTNHISVEKTKKLGNIVYGRNLLGSMNSSTGLKENSWNDDVRLKMPM